MASITCPKCAARVRLPDAAARGKRVRCDECGAAFDPGAAEGQRPGRADGSRTRPRKRRKQGGVGLKWVIILVGGAAAAVLALVLVVVGIVVVLSGRAGPGGGLPAIGVGFPGLNPLVTQANAHKVAQDMTIAQVDAILGPGRTCTYQELRANIESDYGTLYLDAAAPENRGESSWRLWQNGSEKIVAGFHRKSGVERVTYVRYMNLAPGGAFENEDEFSDP